MGMKSNDPGRIAIPFLMLIGLCVFLYGIAWGLPSRRVDSYLFGDHSIWAGEKILSLAGDRNNQSVGSDVDRDPAAAGSVLNETDAQRAQIIRRYRLFTDQPDEMITMMALASMKPAAHDYDPKLYQYGGLWIYPVAALLKLLAPTGTQAYFLDHPERFGMLYVLARLYVVVWGLVGVWAVHRLAARGGAGVIGSIGAALLFIFLPVVVNMAHEAKPHLPGAVLILLSCLSAGKAIDTRHKRWILLTGALCGAATGMILSAAPAFVILPMLRARRQSDSRIAWQMIGAAIAIGVGVYFLTNPYVLIHLLGDRTILLSNLHNSAAMYSAGGWGKGFFNAIRLVIEGTTPLLTLGGILGSIAILRRRERSSLVLLIALAAVILVQFVLLAADKPGEYGRFALIPDIALALVAAIWVGRAQIKSFERIEVFALLMVLTVGPSLIYLRGFSQDAGHEPRRLQNAELLAALHRIGATTLGVYREPAPYLLPPVDLFTWKIGLLPDGFDLNSGLAPVDVIVRPVDQFQTGLLSAGKYELASGRIFNDLFPSRISWAAKPIEIWIRRDLIPRATPATNE